MVAMSAPEKNILLTTLSKEINHPSLSKPAPLKLKPYLLQGGEQQTHSCKAQGRSTLSSTGLLSRIKVSIMVGMHMGPMFFERQTERERANESGWIALPFSQVTQSGWLLSGGAQGLLLQGA